ncbi:hypothetical protein [Legionella sp. km772]|uniref:hypothetical protein n=1 Tax=Legionella sp. km772 TaxID=2498111 RepID=UPI000F8EC047|nr:hypothetical protein [Legionella sp. km772]RUR11144.1 hypothetical protein ELY15_07470 [Legionella sp. km772]
MNVKIILGAFITVLFFGPSAFAQAGELPRATNSTTLQELDIDKQAQAPVVYKSAETPNK